MKAFLLPTIAIVCTVSPLLTIAQSPALLANFPNPTPETSDRFSWAVAALGTEGVLVGAPYDGPTNAGAVYLFRTNGALETTFTNPAPAFTLWFGNPDWDGDLFGIAIAGVGNDRVLIGAPYDTAVWAGRAYLFRTNGTLLTTIDTPSLINGADRFGASVATLGNDRLIISAPGHTTDPDLGQGVGVVYVLNTNGTWLATLDNPDGYQFAEFGFSVAAFGADRVLVGARNTGVAYLFDATGTLLTTFTNPAPALGSYFGQSVAEVGGDRVFIGAPQADEGATDAGVAYLFNTNGAMLTTITNPSPTMGDNFGARVAILGGDRIVISSIYADVGATNSGVAHVFNAKGTLLHSITNPTPAAYDSFGARVAALGTDRVIIGAIEDDQGATDAGMAYLYSIPPAPGIPPSPTLTIQRAIDNSVVISWPAAATGFELQQSTNGVSSGSWSDVTSGVQDDGTNKWLITSPTEPSRFYRLAHP